VTIRNLSIAVELPASSEGAVGLEPTCSRRVSTAWSSVAAHSRAASRSCCARASCAAVTLIVAACGSSAHHQLPATTVASSFFPGLALQFKSELLSEDQSWCRRLPPPSHYQSLGYSPTAHRSEIRLHLNVNALCCAFAHAVSNAAQAQFR
jgi:hypothetical protein